MPASAAAWAFVTPAIPPASLSVGLVVSAFIAFARPASAAAAAPASASFELVAGAWAVAWAAAPAVASPNAAWGLAFAVACGAGAASAVPADTARRPRARSALGSFIIKFDLVLLTRCMRHEAKTN